MEIAWVRDYWERYYNSYTYSTKVIAAISVGGSNVAENGAGPFALDSVNYYSGKSSRFGCRLIYIPQN